MPAIGGEIGNDGGGRDDPAERLALAFADIGDALVGGAVVQAQRAALAIMLLGADGQGLGAKIRL